MIVNLRLALCFFLFLTSPFIIWGQPKCYFEHYGSDDGLPQHSVMDMLQDKNGFMWFATWDGLSKFDGYNFKTYRVYENEKFSTRSNRIEYICEDKYGYIWTTQPYSREPLRFDPKTERFVGIRSFEKYADITFSARKVLPMKSGKVWFVSDRSGCICIVDPQFNIETFSRDNKRIYSNKVNSVYEDSDLNSWILTDNGLYMLANGSNKVTSLFAEKDLSTKQKVQSFHSVMELKSEIWFGSDLGHIWIFNKKTGQFRLFEMKSPSEITHLKSIDENQILIVTQDNGFYIYHQSANHLTHYTTANLNGLRTNKIHSFYLDKQESIWFELDCLGVARFDIVTQKLTHYDAKVETAVSNVYPANFFVLEDRNGRIWVHPRGGGFSLYDKTEDRLIPFYNEPQSSNWRFSNMLHVAYSDRQGNLWMSTRSQGLDKVIFNNEVFQSKIVDKNVLSTVNNEVRYIFEDSKKNMWVSTKLGKIYIYDQNQKELGYLCNNGTIGNGTPLAGVGYTIFEDDENTIWIGTKGEGLYRLTPNGISKSYNLQQYKSSDNDLYSLTGNSIYAIFQDKKKRIWIGTYGTGGLNLLEDSNKGRFINTKNNLKNYPAEFGAQVRIISDDKYGNICVGTTLGLIMFSSDFDSPENIQYKVYTREKNNLSSLRASDIYDICTTRKGDTYLAIFGGGLSKIAEVDKLGFPTRFTNYSIRDGLPSDVVLTVVEDKIGDLWVTTEGNITKFDPKKNLFETYNEVSRMVRGETFSEGSRCLTSTGIVYFGYSRGLIFLNPENVSNNIFKPYVAFTNFQIGNKDVPIGEDSPLKENIDDLKYIKLDHKQNMINIEFVALDYVDPARIVYAYMLEGFDDDWIITKNQRVANYTNLPPGKYKFKVKSTNSDAVWMDNEHVLEIEITPSFWQTRWAYFLYFVVFVLMAYVILRILFVFYRLQDKIKLEQEQAEMKIRFFTDISHEIRTPLTMIVSPVENILENREVTKDVKSQLQLVLKNTNRMIRMVNQILDFRKIQKQKLNIQKTNVGIYVNEICNGFVELAHDKQIKLVVNNEIGDEYLWIDRDNFEKLLFNLLSNAFKYTQADKCIEVTVRSAKKNTAIELEIRDEGIGMTREIQGKLFQRFASFNKDKSQPSTGIGLSIVKEVADKHHAQIEVETEAGHGSRFSIFFQKGLEHFKEDDNVSLATNESVHQAAGETVIEESIIFSEKEFVFANSDQLSILVVEDDVDLRGFIRTMLDPMFRVLEAGDGRSGYETALAEIPDFIISDLMMPEVDGLEFLQKVRSNTTTSHIPFILLTAKSDIESKLSSLKYGADDYITKPFSVRYLKARIENIIERRKSLAVTYTTEHSDNLTDSIAIKNAIITAQDEEFLLKVRTEIDKNMDNSSFLIDDLASAMAMSRTVFFKKLKSLSGQAPVDFIRDIKMNYAAKVLLETQYTVKEIGFMIGMSDTKYFTQCFKKKFRLPPTEFRSRHNLK